MVEDAEIIFIVKGTEEGKRKIRELSREIDQNTKSTERSTRTNLRAVGAVVGLGANIVALGFTYQGLGRAQLNVDRSAQRAAKAQNRLNKLQTSGKATATELQLANEDLRLAQEREKFATENQQRANINFGLSLVTLATSTIPNAITSLSKLGLGHGVAAGAAGVHTGAVALNTTAIKAATLAMLFNPLTAAAVAIAAAAAVALLATNTFGLRDAVFGVTEAVEANTAALKRNTRGYGRYATSIEKAGTAMKTSSAVIVAGTNEMIDANQALIDSLNAVDTATKFASNITIGGTEVNTFGLRTLEKFERRQALINDLQSDYNTLTSQGVGLTELRSILESDIQGKMELQILHNTELGTLNGVNVDLIEEQNEALREQARLQVRLISLVISKNRETAKEKKSLEDAEDEFTGDSPHDIIKRAEARINAILGGNLLFKGASGFLPFIGVIQSKVGKIISQAQALTNIDFLLGLASEALSNNDLAGARQIFDLVSNLNGPSLSGTPSLLAALNQNFPLTPAQAFANQFKSATNVSGPVNFGQASFDAGNFSQNPSRLKRTVKSLGKPGGLSGGFSGSGAGAGTSSKHGARNLGVVRAFQARLRGLTQILSNLPFISLFEAQKAANEAKRGTILFTSFGRGGSGRRKTFNAIPGVMAKWIEINRQRSITFEKNIVAAQTATGLSRNEILAGVTEFGGFGSIQQVHRQRGSRAFMQTILSLNPSAGFGKFVTFAKQRSFFQNIGFENAGFGTDRTGIGTDKQFFGSILRDKKGLDILNNRIAFMGYERYNVVGN